MLQENSERGSQRRKFAVRITAAGAATAMSLAVLVSQWPLARASGTRGVNDYPNQDAVCAATGLLGGYCPNYEWGYNRHQDANGVWVVDGRDIGLSPRGFGYRNCTDFVAYRLGITWSSLAFPKSQEYPLGDGNARGWKQGAINSGYRVGNVPVPGAVAWWGAGIGHVAVVTSVNPDGTANIEQYNAGGDGTYSPQPNVSADAYLYIGVAAPGNSTVQPKAPSAPINGGTGSPLQGSTPTQPLQGSTPTQPLQGTTPGGKGGGTSNSLAQYAWHIVQWDGDTKAQKTAWLVDQNLNRRWIPTAAVYWCLKSAGAPGPDVLPSSTLDQLPDLTGVSADCQSLPPATSRSPQAPPAPPGNASIIASQGGQYGCAGCSALNIAVHNFPVGTYTYACHDNSGPGGADTAFYSHSVSVTDPNQSSWPGVFCDDSAPYVAYLVMDGVTSNKVSFSAPASAPPAQPAPPVQPAPPATYGETAGGVLHTWTNYTNAGGTEGPSVSSGATVQIACKVTGFKVADGNTWWYRIASSPWNSAYYVSADGFYNNGQTSGSLSGTPLVDPAVPNC